MRPATVAQRLGDRAPLAVSLRFFGQEAVGQRFAFIVDCSGSMEGERWTTCCQQLESALRAMPAHVEFVVVLFSSHLIEPPAQTGWTRAEPAAVDGVIGWLSAMWAGGGTIPEPAFGRVFAYPSPPDVVYFLTDGDIGSFTPDRCARIRGDAPTVVNAIALENDASRAALEEMAVATGGQFILIPDVSKVAADA